MQLRFRDQSTGSGLLLSTDRHHSKTSGAANQQKLLEGGNQESCRPHGWAIFLVTHVMAFFQSAIGSLQTITVALGAGLGVWGAINLLEGYGNDNPGAKSQGMKQLMAGGGVALVGTTLVPLLAGLF